MAIKNSLRYIFFIASTLFIFSCHSPVELVKRKYRPVYFAYSGEKENKKSTSNCNSSDNLLHNPAWQSNFLNPTNVNVHTKDNLLASIAKAETKKIKITEPSVEKQKIKFPQSNTSNHAQDYSYHILSPSTPSDKPIAAPATPLLYKISIICLSLCLLSLFCIFASYLFPAFPLLAYIAATFPESWLTGIILAIIGFIKYRKNPGPAEPKRLERLSMIAFILSLMQFLVILFIIIATFLIIYSITPLIVLMYLFGAMALVSFVFGIIGLIRVLRDVQQSRKNRFKAILISIFSLVPVILMIAWFVAVGTFIAAALPYLTFLIFILH